MGSFFNKKSSWFIILISLFLLVLFLDFIFFYPKFGESIDEENLRYLGYKSINETKKILIGALKPGDIVAEKPSSFIGSYQYALEKGGVLTNFFFFIFYYNLFDKIFINSMGEDGYWHVYIYLGNGTLNSLDFTGVENRQIDENFLKSGYYKLLRVNAEEEFKQKAIQKAVLHERNKDISYSLKNGVIVVFSKSTGIFPFAELDEDSLVCSSYQALIYNDISFTPGKQFTYISPEDIDESELTETVFIKNKKGVYIK